MIIDYYQSIPALGIVGRKPTQEEFEKIGLPPEEPDLSKSVLDIGCNMGAFLLECRNRFADTLIGIEPNLDWRLLANGILFETLFDKSVPDFDTYASFEDLEKDTLKRRDIPQLFDLVLLLSVTHVVQGMTGQEILDKAYAFTKPGGLLIVEINDRLQKEPLKLPDGGILFGKNKDNRSVWHFHKK